jgi:hypothetical protein
MNHFVSFNTFLIKNPEEPIYRPEQTVEILRSPISLSGEAILPGVLLDLGLIWA